MRLEFEFNDWGYPGLSHCVTRGRDGRITTEEWAGEADPAAWNAFWEVVDLVGAWQWEGPYKQPIMDGHHWDLCLRRGEERVDCSGENGYPAGYMVLRRALSRMLPDTGDPATLDEILEPARRIRRSLDGELELENLIDPFLDLPIELCRQLPPSLLPEALRRLREHRSDRLWSAVSSLAHRLQPGDLEPGEWLDWLVELQPGSSVVPATLARLAPRLPRAAELLWGLFQAGEPVAEFVLDLPKAAEELLGRLPDHPQIGVILTRFPGLAPGFVERALGLEDRHRAVSWLRQCGAEGRAVSARAVAWAEADATLRAGVLWLLPEAEVTHRLAWAEHNPRLLADWHGEAPLRLRLAALEGGLGPERLPGLLEDAARQPELAAPVACRLMASDGFRALELARVLGREGVPALLAALQVRYAEVRRQAVELLAELGVSDVLRLADDPDLRVRDAVRTARLRFQPDHADELLAGAMKVLEEAETRSIDEVVEAVSSLRVLRRQAAPALGSLQGLSRRVVNRRVHQAVSEALLALDG